MAAYSGPFPTDAEKIAAALRFFAQSRELYAVVRRRDDALIGFLALNETGRTRQGFCVHSAYRRKGNSVEVTSALMEAGKRRGGYPAGRRKTSPPSACWRGRAFPP